MAYDEKLAERIKDVLVERTDVEVKKMFGGLCFMVSQHMCCGIVGDMLMARVGPERYDKCLSQKHASEMDFTGKAMKGMVYVSAEGIRTKAQLKRWVGMCTEFVESLPAKQAK